MAVRSPWTLTALALAWLGCTSVLAAKPLDMALLWLLGLGAGAYLVRPVSGGGDVPAPVSSTPLTEIDSAQPQDPGQATPPVSPPEVSPAGPQDPGPPAGAALNEPEVEATSTVSRGPASTPPPLPTAEPASLSSLGPRAPLRTLTAEEVAAALRVDLADVIAAMAAGQLPGNQIAEHWRCNETSLTTWLDGTWSSNRPSATGTHDPR